MAKLDVQIPEAFGFLFDPPLGSVRYRVSYGGRGAAKSWQYARALLIHGMQQPLRVLCTREFQANIKDSVHLLLSDQITALGLGGFYRVQDTEIAGINGTTANTYVNVWTRNKTYGGNSVTGARRHGGVVGAAASGGVRSNMTLVGEAGPEIVNLPTGSRVRSNPDTRRMMSGSGGGGGPVVIEIRSSGSAVDDMLMEIFRKAVHVRGGDVQIAVMGK